MKKTFYLFVILSMATITGTAQNYWPQQSVKEMNGRTKNLADYAPERGVVLFVFWKTCCPNNITMFEELYEVWMEYDNDDMPVKIVLVSLDDQRSASRVRPIVSTNGWEWEVIMDKNGDLARLYHVIVPPQWIAFDKSGREIFRSKVTSGALDSSIYFDELITEINKTN